MPTECERSLTSPTKTTEGATNSTESREIPTTLNFNEDLAAQSTSSSSFMMEGGGNDPMSTSQTSTTSNGSSSCNGGRKTSITSPDPTAYVAKARVTRPTPPPPPYNPMQFVQIKPCNLYQTAQEQLKKAEEVKKIKEIRKEEPEDWQNNLDNWKSSRRKRVEHIIDRVVEVKKLELEEHDRTRRKSKTFSEMIEERGERSGGRGLNKLASLAVYAEDEANDLSDLGIGTSSASGKSSLSEDYDNNSVMSDNAAELDKAINNSTHHKPATTESTTREYISSPGYETSSSTAPASSPDPCEYTYEGAIQDYKQRVSRAASGLTSVALNKLTSQQQLQHQTNSKESTPERPLSKETSSYPPRRGSKIEDRLMGFEVQSPSEECVEKSNKVDVPKIDILKRKEIFESQQQQEEPKTQQTSGIGGNSSTQAPRITLRDRFKVQEMSSEPLTEQPKKELKRLSGDITSIKERLQSLEQQKQNLVNGANGASKTTATHKLVDIPVPPLKERLSSLQNAVTKEEIRKPPVVLVDARQLEIMKSEEEKAQLSLKENKLEESLIKEKALEEELKTSLTKSPESEEVDRDDSGIHTADDVDLEERNQADLMKKEQELKLNAAIEALAKEEQQLSEAANAVNQIEAEFEELTLGSVALPPLASNSTASATPITNDHMEYSVSSTNPQAISNCSTPNSKNNEDNLNLSLSHNNNNDSSLPSSDSVPNDGSSSNDNKVKGLDFKSASNLRRKPTNEMVHAKNLLRIFKDTFQNDIELDEHEVNEEHETKDIPEKVEQKNKNDLSLNIEKEFKEVKTSPDPQTKTPQSPLVAHRTVTTPLSPASYTPSIIPLGKPPMSPLTIRSASKFAACTPPSSPSLSRKNDSQFSINGRVEIFNSRNMATSPTSPTTTANFVKPTTPTMTTKKTQMPYINKPKITQSNNIELPKQLPQEVVTTKELQQQHITTVIEPLLSNQQQHQHQTQNDKVKIVELKSMPSQQMVNEPQTKLDGETYHHQQQQQKQELANHSKDSVKQQQTEIVVCAPPITIVNPDELPKPNTVKNLSSCFQQQQQQQPSHSSNVRSVKPLPRSRIPHATPPSSPALPRRQMEIPKTPTKPEEEKKLSVISTFSTSSLTKPEEEKKLSMISSSSTSSSSSTGSTVIDAGKTLSFISQTSNTSEDVEPTLVKVKAQVHEDKEKVNHIIENEVLGVIGQEKVKIENSEKPAKVLDSAATQALVDAMILGDKQARTLILDTKDMVSKPKEFKTSSDSSKSPTVTQPNIPSDIKDMAVKTKEIKPLTPLKINTDNHLSSENSYKTPNISSPSVSMPETPKSPTSPSRKPFTSPLAAMHSPQSELFKNTTPLVVSTLYDKHRPSPLANNNQRTPLAPLKPLDPPTTPTIMIPAELPQLPDCSPNDSTLYKLASSAPHSPKSPSSNSELNMDIDSALCNSLLTSLAAAPQAFQRQYTVEEDVCQKVNKETLPFHEGSTGFKDISQADIKKCSGLAPSKAPKLQTTIAPQRQITVEEELCQKLDKNQLPDDDKHGKQAITGFKSLSPTEIINCDNFFANNSGKPSSKPNSKPTSPIMEARAAHSKALIETCEKIIAEERLANTQLKSSLPSSPAQTPVMARKSKIPKPITSCCKVTESLNEADLIESTKPKTPTTPQEAEGNGVIARMHVVETQIKVTTTTPPASPKVPPKPQPSPQTQKKTKNIFDFLKKNFGVGHNSNKEEIPTQTPETSALTDSASSSQPQNKVLVLSEEELKDLDTVKYDEIHKFDNSKFYIPAEEMASGEVDEAMPPPLPKTPAPVNIEITRKIITNEILEDGKTEKDLTQEIDDLLDDELNKLNYEIEELEKVGKKQ